MSRGASFSDLERAELTRLFRDDKKNVYQCTRYLRRSRSCIDNWVVKLGLRSKVRRNTLMKRLLQKGARDYAVVPPEVAAARAQSLSVPLTADMVVLGDPAPGRSALHQKRAREREQNPAGVNPASAAFISVAARRHRNPSSPLS